MGRSRPNYTKRNLPPPAQGCDCGVLACTELSVFASQHHLSSFYLDAMAVLAERSVQACRKPLRDIFVK